MKAISSSALALLVGLSLTGCDRPTGTSGGPATPIPEPVAATRTLETERLGEAVDRYQQDPSAENKAAVKERMAKLDGEIAELEGRVARVDGADREEATAKMNNLKSYRDKETARFTLAEGKAAITAPPERTVQTDRTVPADRVVPAERAVPVVPADPADPGAPVDTRTGSEKAADAAHEAKESIKDAAHAAGQTLKDIVK